MVLENFLIDVDVLWDRAGKELYEKPKARAGRKMRVRVTNNGLAEDLTGYTLNLGWKSTIDETKFGLDAFSAVNITEGIFELSYTTGMLTNIGTLIAALQLVPTVGEPTESNNFTITVNKSAVDAEAVQSETSFTALALALVNVNAWNATISGKVIDWEADMEATKQTYIATMNDVEATYTQELVSLGQQLEQTDTEIVGTNLRIDGLIIPLSPENANLEVTNALTSVVKGKAFTTLSNRIEEAEGDFKTLVDSELNEDHIIRSVPNGVSDYYDSSLGVFKKNVGHTVLDGGETFDSFVSTSTNVYKMMITGWVTAKNAVQGNVTTFEAVNADSTLDKIAAAIGGGGLLVNTIALSDGALHLYLEKTKVDAMTGVTLLDRCKQYLSLKPIDLKYQLVTGVDINLPNELSANTQWIIKAFGDLTLLSSALISENETWEV